MSKSEVDDGNEQAVENEYAGLEDIRFVFNGGNISGQWPDGEKLIEHNGGIVSDSVSEETDYLVVGDNLEQTELDAAREYDVPTLIEEEFIELLDHRTSR